MEIDYENGYINQNGEFVYIEGYKQKFKRIEELKKQISKYKEDVEQVELFGMQRADYEQKKQACVQIVEELRALETQLKGE